MEREVKIWEQHEIVSHKKYVRMKIAICDKNYINLKTIKNIIYRYAERKKMEIVVECYYSGDELLMCDTKYHLIFLGELLADSSGLDTAINLREYNSFSSIVFISKSTELVFKSLKVNPYSFLTTPVDEISVSSLLDEFFEKFGCNYPLWLKSRNDTVCLNTNEIFFLEANNKHCFIHLNNQTLSCNHTMAKVYGVLPKNYFLKINRAFIVNINYVFKYNNDTLQLKNGTKLHISRNYLNSFKEDYRRLVSPYVP